MWSVARRPRWIAALLFALALAATFALLSQWQLSRSVTNGTVVSRDTETVEQLTAIAKPQTGATDAQDGQLVAASGRWVPGDALIVSDRLNHGDKGYWVVGHFSVDTADGGADAGAGLPVAVGWAKSESAARAALTTLNERSGTGTVSGRYFAGEAPQDSDFEHGVLSSVSAGAMLNTWKSVDPAGIYGGYLVSAKAPAGLTAIYSPAPTSSVEVNWLNIFYAVEWIVFAGFAVFLWYRLVRDAHEREQEELEQEQAQQAGSLERAEVN
jgi:cytochrome oxidase assembly protein ShyY1